MELFVPGRICLFGEHSDWAGSYRRQNAAIEKGYTIITGTNQGIYARVTQHPDSLVVRSALPDGSTQNMQVPMQPAELLDLAQQGGFFSYAAGVAYQVLKHWKVGGLSLDNYRMDLPLKKGLSSSAALCVLVARAFNRLYDLQLTVQGEMDLAYRGEIMTPSRCGRMDQGCAYGQRPILMTFDQELVEVEPLRPAGIFHLLIVDLKGRKDTVKILADLNRSYPFARNDRDKAVHDYLGPDNMALVLQAIQALNAGDAAALGALMTRAQAAFDEALAPSSPEELAAPLLHQLLALPDIQQDILGGKGVGSQGDGTAQLLCRDADARRRVTRIIEKQLGMACLPLDIQPVETVSKALIPAAGFGGELFPSTKVMQKELFPVVDARGVAKPVLLANCEEAARCHPEEVVVVVNPADRPAVTDFFQAELTPDRMHRLPEQHKAWNRTVQALGRQVTLVDQDKPAGFGHAVYQARDRLKDGPFLLLLGDYLYCADGPLSCAEQMVQAYQTVQRCVIGIKVITDDMLGAYGVVGGHWIKEGELLEVTDIVEKPSVKYARERLRVPTLSPGEYLGLFGLYVLPPQVFDCLETVMNRELDVAGQYELTTGLALLRKTSGCVAYVVQGESYDMGFPDSYLAALEAFRRRGGNKGL